MRRISATGSSARRTEPDKAMPVTPVRIRESMSSYAMPPMATIGSAIPLSRMRRTMSR